MSIRRCLENLLACIAIAGLAAVTPVSAGTILLYDDYQVSGNRWNDALIGLGHTVTSVADDSAFSSQLSAGPWDLVVVQFDSTSHSSASSALGSYVGAGKKAIFGHWLTEADSAFGVTEAGWNLDTLTITNPLLSSGLSSSVLSLANPTYGVYSRSFLTVDAIAATFEDSNAGIVIGNSGRTIINGFLGDTLGYSDEVRLYQNEVNSLLGGQQPVPEPGTFLLLGAGLAGAALARRKFAARG